MTTLTRSAWLYGQPQLRHDTRGRHQCWCGSTALVGGKWCSVFCRDREEIDSAHAMGINLTDYHRFRADLPESLVGSVEDFTVRRDSDPHWMKR